MCPVAVIPVGEDPDTNVGDVCEQSFGDCLQLFPDLSQARVHGGRCVEAEYDIYGLYHDFYKERKGEREDIMDCVSFEKNGDIVNQHCTVIHRDDKQPHIFQVSMT